MKIVLLILFLFFPSTGAPAAEPKKEETLDPVVVTATRTETPLRDVTTSITVITEEEIRAQQAETVLDALRDVPGLDVVQSGSRGSTTSVFIRGSNSNQVLVLIDGMEVNSGTAGSFNFAHLLTDNVERIEVLRGAGGTLYGSKAVGGVINILTKRGEGTPKLSLSSEGGNGATHRQALDLAGGTSRWNYSVAGNFLQSDGFHGDNDDYQNVSTSTRVGYQVMDHASLSGTFWMAETTLGLFNSNVSRTAPDPNDRQEDQFLTTSLQWKHELNPNWDYRLGMGLTHSDNKNIKKIDTVDTTNSVSSIRNRIMSPEFQINYTSDLTDVTFGVDWDILEAQFSGTRREQNNQALYLQNRMRLLDENLILVGGVRWDNNEDFGKEWSPSASAAYLIRKTGTKLKWNYAESFRAPTFNDLFFPGFSNPDLSPEKAWEIDFGVEQRLWKDRLGLEVIYFHREVDDLIVFKGSRPENIGQTIFDGVELSAVLRLPWGLSWKGNYTFLNVSDRITRRPKHKGNLTLNYKNGPLNVNLNTHITGSRLDVDAVTFKTINKGGYTRFDLASSYMLPWKSPWVNGLSLYGKIENLFDKEYEEADGFRARPLNFLFGIRGSFGQD